MSILMKPLEYRLYYCTPAYTKKHALYIHTPQMYAYIVLTASLLPYMHTYDRSCIRIPIYTHSHMHTHRRTFTSLSLHIKQKATFKCRAPTYLRALHESEIHVYWTPKPSTITITIKVRISVTQPSICTHTSLEHLAKSTCSYNPEHLWH